MQAGTLRGIFAAFAAAVFCLAVLPSSTYATVTIEASMQGLHPPGGFLNGTLTLRFDRLLPEDSQIKIYLDGSAAPLSVIDVQPYISGISYQFKQHLFTYDIIANGKNEWQEYPGKQFYYRLSASGTCGNQQCAETGTCDCAGLCTPPQNPPYSCIWSITYNDLGASVSANEGLKRIFDGTDVIFPPASANSQDTLWSQVLNTESQYGVHTTMRMACGGMNYMGQTTEPNGWVKRSLPNEQFEGIPGTTSKKITIEPFDEQSLAADKAKFVEGGCSQPYVCGGIYRDGTRLTSGFSVNGSTGEITISNFNPTATYTITYLSPNGPLVCAYTNYTYSNSSTWTKIIGDSGNVSYVSPFSKTYTETQLPYAFNSTNKFFVNPPACPDYAYGCSQKATSYSAIKTSDPSGGYISVSYSSSARTVSASLSSPDLAKNYSKTMLIPENLKAPALVGEHTLLLSLQSSGQELAKTQFGFSVCRDEDRDSFCPETGDCNDTNTNVNPGKKELCNKMDDDCDSQVDEDFTGAEKMLGSPCGRGICKGIYVCSTDRKEVVCSNESLGGREICGNTLDDDCDGVVDEMFESEGGVAARACDACKAGERKPCGSNVGACREGYTNCVDGDWSRTCLNKKGPFEEECNGIDDDCDAVVDNIYGGNSDQETGCGCYGGVQTSQEVCDSIDNDCNGLTDDGIQCCTEGETRPCGLSKGACISGQQTCREGYWEMECKGGTRPNPEVCYNEVDDNCNGETDENCSPDFTCRNGMQDLNEQGIDCGGQCPEACGLPYGWILFALGVILLIGVAAFLGLK